MKQILQDRQSGEVQVVEVPGPALLPGGVLVSTRASLISSGTERSTVTLGAKSLVGKARARPDLVRKVIESVRAKGLAETLRTVRARLAEPSVLGYSAAGVVDDVAPGLDGFTRGDRVACAGQGIASHAEVNFVPRNLVVRLPEALSFEEGAFVALGSIALHGVRTAGVVVGDHVVVVGLGLVGLLTVQLLKAAGCVVYGLDPMPQRAELARQLGADVVSSASDEMQDRIESGTGGRGADAVLLAASTSSNEPVRFAAEVARDRGTVCVVGDVGLDIPREAYYRKELVLRISRSYGPGRYDDAYEVLGQQYPVGFVPWDQRRNMEGFLAMVADRRVSVAALIAERYPVDQAPEAYRRIAPPEGSGPPPIAVVVTYPETRAPSPTSSVRVAAQVRSGKGIAVIGAGNFARATLLPRIAANNSWRRTIVVTTSGPSAHGAAKDFGFERAGTNPEEALSDPDVGAVVIATRHDTHAPLVARAVRAGLAVFVEKPLAISLEGLKEIAAAVHDTGNDRVFVGFNRRHSAFAAGLAAHFPNGAQAVNYRVNAGPLPADHWTRRRDEGGGRLIGEGCHFVDLISFLVRSLVTEVHCHAAPATDGGSPDTLQVNLRYGNGAVGHLLYVSTGDPKQPKELVEVFGMGRSGVLDNFQRLDLWRNGKAATRKAGLSVDKGIDAEIAAFLRAAASPANRMPVPFTDLVNTTLATFAAELSATERRPVLLEDLLPTSA